MQKAKHYGRTVSSKEITSVLNYLDFATPKQKLDIKILASKELLTEAEYKRIKSYIFKYKMYIQSNSNNVDARLNKLKRTSLTYPNPKHI